MDNTSYIALSRQMTLQRELDISANNLANMNTTGYKFEELLVNTQAGAPAYDSPIRTPANFAYDSGVGRDFSQGALNQTGAPLDLALSGEGTFFVVGGPKGNAYTRDGAFSLDSTGTLVTQDGYPVQGDGGPIVLDPKKGEPTISKDGIITQMYQGQAERVGKLNIVRIANMSDLSKNGDSTYSLVSNAQALPATDANVEQGYLEASNVNPMKEITHLVQINRAYESLANIIEQNASLSKSAIERLGKVA
ncbi:flagellar basal-body rod protein FlgF [Asticcacaulis sp. EMRT-3]|uniref:flagellar basal-body rod protein FlgF n=1 Tax=Asticcacaulis sp. EMRT-3 TaxID=3040349 RepID=UPI0024AF9ECA|nr:flagellar basal-body rod protein FlgF [Asticcacaulis sp. EMRT-3]MDI7773799.1 flagellar basal-body rod protein FlgF [Asticcacaulis sp. EMRT-3]